MKRVIYAFLLISLSVLAGLNATAQEAPKLSRMSRIYLLNVDPGPDLYAVYGHSALWVSDEVNNLSEVYDYGVFDFDAPDFYTNFLMGNMQYRRVQHEINSFLMTFYMQEREVTAKQIFLDTIAKQKLYDLLWHNSLPGNDTYHYDFVKDNCATQMRDLLDAASLNRITWKYPEHQYSLRSLLHAEMKHFYWTQFGYDLLLGAGSDTIMDARKHNFLPKYLFKHAALAKYKQGDLFGPDEPMLNVRRTWEIKDAWYYSPLMVFGGLMLLILSLLYWAHIPKCFDITWFILLGILGCLLFFMSNYTAHHVMKQNWNLLWVHPFLLIWPFVLSYSTKPRVRSFGHVILIAIGLALVFGVLLPQRLPIASYAINVISMLLLTYRLYPGFYKKVRRWHT